MSVGHRRGLQDSYGRPLEPGDEVIITTPIIGRYVIQDIRPITHVNPTVQLPPGAVKVVLMAIMDPLIVQAWKPSPLMMTRTKAELIKAGLITDTGEAQGDAPAEATEEARVDRGNGETKRPGPALVLTDVERKAD